MEVPGFAGDHSQMIVEDEQLLPSIPHRVLAEVLYEISDGHGLVVFVDRRHDERMSALVREQHFQTSTNEFDQ